MKMRGLFSLVIALMILTLLPTDLPWEPFDPSVSHSCAQDFSSLSPAIAIQNTSLRRQLGKTAMKHKQSAQAPYGPEQTLLWLGKWLTAKITTILEAHSRSDTMLALLQDLKTFWNAGGETFPYADARFTLRKLLYDLHPGHAVSTYIRDNLQELAYSPKELAQLTQAGQARAARSRRINALIRQGVSPYLAHVMMHKRDGLNPFPFIGFYPLDNRIVPLWGPKYFRSVRQMELNDLAYWSELKKVHLLAAAALPVSACNITKAAAWDSLPVPLKTMLQQGNILVTTSEDLYELTDDELRSVVAAEDIHALATAINTKINTTALAPPANIIFCFTETLFYPTSEEPATSAIPGRNHPTGNHNNPWY